MTKKFFKPLLLILTFICFFCRPLVVSAKADNYSGFQGKTISILGDSICTYKNYSSGNSADSTNSTIRNNRDYYYDGRHDVTIKDTWWIQAKNKLGAKILVNNSYSGTTIFIPGNTSRADTGLARAVNLHDNTGKNSGKKPDIIAVYMGTNDFSYHKSKLGTAEAINYKKLITKQGSRYVYANPQTSCEAYAIMLHKIHTKYPKSEIYCFTTLPRETKDAKEKTLLKNFNKSIKQIADHFNCYIVDLYNDTGITDNPKLLNRYIYDGHVHPNKKGMDAITNAFLSSLYENSKYAPKDENVFNVTYKLNNVIVNEGLLKKAIKNTAFNCSFSKLTYGNYKVTVKMGDKNITSECYSGGKINIPAIKDDIVISASISKIDRNFPSYRFKKYDNRLINMVNNENTPNEIVKNTSGSYTMQKSIKLYYDSPWTVVFRTNSFIHDTNVILSSDKENGVKLVLNQMQNIIGFSEKKDPYKVFGYNLKKLNLDHNKTHTYKITNTYNIDGTNTFTLYIDGKKIGKLDTCYVNGKYHNQTSFLNERDLTFNIIGSKYSTSLIYVQIWGNKSIPDHVHTYSYAKDVKATCTNSACLLKTCDCGNKYRKIKSPPLGHKESGWIVTKKATTNTPGEKQKKCSVCKKVTQTKKIPQLKCKQPVVSTLSNTYKGIQVTWKAVSGADSYRVFHRVANGKWEFIGSTTTTTYYDENIKNGYWYYYTVKASNEAGFSDYDEIGKVIQALNTPVFKSAYNVDCGIKLIYSSINGATGYYIYRKAGNGNWQCYAIAKSTTYIDKNVSNGVTYSYRVKAFRDKTVSGFIYEPVNVQFVSTPTIKTPINTDSGVKIQWDKINGAKEYRVFRKNSKNEWVYSGKSTSLSYTDTSAVAGKKYTYTVKAVNNNDVVSGYNFEGVTSVRLPTPQPRGYDIICNNIRIKWNAVNGAKGYYIYRKTGKNGWTYLGKSTGTSFIDTSAKKGVTYLYVVKAYNDIYTSTYKATGITAKR